MPDNFVLRILIAGDINSAYSEPAARFDIILDVDFAFADELLLLLDRRLDKACLSIARQQFLYVNISFSIVIDCSGFEPEFLTKFFLIEVNIARNCNLLNAVRYTFDYFKNKHDGSLVLVELKLRLDLAVKITSLVINLLKIRHVFDDFVFNVISREDNEFLLAEFYDLHQVLTLEVLISAEFNIFDFYPRPFLDTVDDSPFGQLITVNSHAAVRQTL